MDYIIDMEEAKSLLSPLHYAHLVKHVDCEGECPVRNGLLKEMERARMCPVCGCDRTEHNWEAHTAEMRADALSDMEPHDYDDDY